MGKRINNWLADFWGNAALTWANAFDEEREFT
jgi:hypothetical protein